MVQGGGHRPAGGGAEPVAVHIDRMRAVEKIFQTLFHRGIEAGPHAEADPAGLPKVGKGQRGRSGRGAGTQPNITVLCQTVGRRHRQLRQCLPVEGGNRHQPAAAVELPAVVGALDVAVAHLSGRQRRIAVRTAVFQGGKTVPSLVKQHIVAVEQGDGLRFAPHCTLACGDVPVIVQRHAVPGRQDSANCTTGLQAA